LGTNGQGPALCPNLSVRGGPKEIKKKHLFSFQVYQKAKEKSLELDQKRKEKKAAMASK
jgi:hypothetical protein